MGQEQRRVRRRTFGLATVVLLAVTAVGLTSCSSTGAGGVTLLRSHGGRVTGYLSYENDGFGNQLEIRFTSGTGRSISIRTSQPPTPADLDTTVVDTGTSSPWTAVSALGPPSWAPRVGRPPVVLRLTTTADGDLPLTFEVRAQRHYPDGRPDEPTWPGLRPVTASGPDCARAPSRTDLTNVDLRGLDLHNCVIADAKVDPAKLDGTRLDGADLSGTTFVPGTLTTGLQSTQLREATFDGVTLTATANIGSSDLTGAHFAGATLQGTILTGATVTGTDLRTASLQTITSGDLIGAPLLPPRWTVRNGYLLGPTAQLNFADLHGQDLHGLDLSQTSLHETNLTGTNLSGADLTGADLTGTTLTGANLAGAKLAGAQLVGVHTGGISGTPASLPTGWSLAGGYLFGPDADLHGLDLHGVDLHGRDLSGASFAGSDLTGANLTGANLSHSYFNQANVTSAQLAGANLFGVDSRPLTGVPASLPAGVRLVDQTFVTAGAHLDGADLSGADLSGLDLHEVACSGCKATGTNLTGANLTKASLWGLPGANLTNADLSGSFLADDFSGVNLTGAKLAGATFTWLRSGGVVGQPASVPTGVFVAYGYLFGPQTSVTSADLHGADLRNRAFDNTDLSDVNLAGADLRGASFTNSVLGNTNFAGARIDGMVLTGVLSFYGSDFTGATGTPVYAGVSFESAICPDGTNGYEHDNTCQGHPWP